jgi:hypothetical protein
VISVEKLLQDHHPEIQAIVEQIRNLILTIVPSSTESANAGWHSISYRHPQQGYYCGIFPTQDKVILVFEYGILLPDPEGVLEGSGKQVRNVLIDSPDKIPSLAIQKLLVEAINLPLRKAEKLELIRALNR